MKIRNMIQRVCY